MTDNWVHCADCAYCWKEQDVNLGHCELDLPPYIKTTGSKDVNWRDRSAMHGCDLGKKVEAT